MDKEIIGVQKSIVAGEILRRVTGLMEDNAATEEEIGMALQVARDHNNDESVNDDIMKFMSCLFGKTGQEGVDMIQSMINIKH